MGATLGRTGTLRNPAITTKKRRKKTPKGQTLGREVWNEGQYNNQQRFLLCGCILLGGDLANKKVFSHFRENLRRFGRIFADFHSFQ